MVTHRDRNGSCDACCAAAAEPPRFESGPALIDYLDQLYQGQSSEAQMVMEIKTPDYERRLVFKGMTQGDDYAYFQILEPKKIADCLVDARRGDVEFPAQD